MKISSFYYKISALCFCITFMGCQDYIEVDNPSKVAEENIFDDTGYTYSALVGVYGELIGDNGYGNRLSEILPQAGDDFETSGDYNCNDRRGISMFEACSSNPELNLPFQQLYSGIERANLCIANIPNSSIYGSGSASEIAEMDRYYGEALALRAQFYYELIRNWGDVPYQDQPAAEYDNLFLEKTDRDSIYEQIITDLGEAATLVPWRSEAGIPPTRLSKGAILGLRARLALARAGFSLRREPQQMLQGDNPETYYEIARNACREVMQHRNEHDLNPSFEALFRSLHEGRPDETNEIMFSVGAFGGNSKTDSKLGYYNGLQHARASTWNGGGGVNALPTYFYEFDRNDQRRDVTINIFEINDDDQTQVANAGSWTDGKFRKSWTDITGPSQNLAINWPILRFSDVLLMFAEADNELNNGPSQEAIGALEEVRTRAFLGSTADIESAPTGKQAFFEAVVHERLLEFGGESIRKYDLIRWNLLDEVYRETRQNLNDFMNGTGAYSNVPEYIYYQPGDYDPSLTAQETVENLNIFFSGNEEATVFYNATPSDTPNGYSQAAWRAGIQEEYIDSERKGWFQYYEPNHSELLPIYDDIINTNYNLTQDYGY